MISFYKDSNTNLIENLKKGQDNPLSLHQSSFAFKNKEEKNLKQGITIKIDYNIIALNNQ